MTIRIRPFPETAPEAAATGTSAPRCTISTGSERPAISSQRCPAQRLFAITRSAAPSAATHARRPIALSEATWIMSGPCAETTNAGRSAGGRRATHRAAACPAGARQWA